MAPDRVLGSRPLLGRLSVVAVKPPANASTTRTGAETLVWRGDKCGLVTLANVNPGEDYKIGDEEECVLCDDMNCLATVEKLRSPYAP
jgi:hypothetical protein